MIPIYEGFRYSILVFRAFLPFIKCNNARRLTQFRTSKNCEIRAKLKVTLDTLLFCPRNIKTQIHSCLNTLKILSSNQTLKPYSLSISSLVFGSDLVTSPVVVFNSNRIWVEYSIMSYIKLKCCNSQCSRRYLGVTFFPHPLALHT